MLSDHQVADTIYTVDQLNYSNHFPNTLFRVSLPHTILMMVSGYIVCMIVQWGLIKCSEMITGINLVEIKDSASLSITYQIISDTVLIVISVILRRLSLWFTFIPYATTLSFKMTKSNIIILTTATSILFIFGITLKYSSLIFGFSIWLVCLIALLTISFRREFQVD